jgi:hypothetical protein
MQVNYSGDQQCRAFTGRLQRLANCLEPTPTPILYMSINGYHCLRANISYSSLASEMSICLERLVRTRVISYRSGKYTY